MQSPGRILPFLALLALQACAHPSAPLQPIRMGTYSFGYLFEAKYPTCRTDHGTSEMCAEVAAKIGNRPFEPAHRSAKQSFAAGLTGGDAAGSHFIACAAAYRDVPDSDLLRHTAQSNAQVCYRNAMNAFANVGRFASTGKPLLEQAATEDPRLATFIHSLLAKPPYDLKQ